MWVTCKNPKSHSFILHALQGSPSRNRKTHPDLKGKSGLGPRGCTIGKLTWVIEIYKTLEARLLENTMIVVFHDNGPVLK